jgi:hypothetical protein
MNLDEKHKICLEHAVRIVKLLIEKDRVKTDSLSIATKINMLTRELMLEWK